MSRTLELLSDGETLQADLYGDLPAHRAAILVHGRSWDASGWRDIAPRFVARGIPTLALNLRGYDGSTGKTDEFVDGRGWSPVTDLRAAKAALREQGAREIALVGASMGGHAVLASSFDGDIECVVSISAPVVDTPDVLSRKITGRKLFVLADEDPAGPFGAAQQPGGVLAHTMRAFAVASHPKTMLVFGGKEHARGIFAAPYGGDALDAIVDFVAKGL